MSAGRESSVKEGSVILIVDDHPAVRSALTDGIKASFPAVHCLEASSGEAAVQSAATSAPDIVLVDIEMPGIGGIEATRRIRAANPAVHIVVLSIHDEPSSRAEAQAAGANVFVSKRNVRGELMPLLARLARVLPSG